LSPHVIKWSPIEAASVCALFGLDGIADTDRAGSERDEPGAKPRLAVPPRVPGQSPDRLLEAFRSWISDEDGWFSILHGEILARA
jgi:hypothetical protein